MTELKKKILSTKCFSYFNPPAGGQMPSSTEPNHNHPQPEGPVSAAEVMEPIIEYNNK